ncbi:carbohydrate ABC transporter permease [Paenibacillus flagellatus]|uniref:ABC transporter permease n=1 Tax=Paenibacillus flagellatus TaxID=2211139 RepID=A0A2V5KU78_9BACL|nr:carbohydrate ABC transporter permease [Paenibacillus flagellatus]PYI52856.1 ABC transporter permease [Paenibacillus flagellatus]
MKRMTAKEKGTQAVIMLLLALLAACCVFPFFYVASLSFTTAGEAIRRGIVLIPEHPVLSAYEQIFSGTLITRAYQVTLFVTVVGTVLNLLFTTATAYPLARKSLPGRNVFLLYIIFTMLFSGGMIPHFLLVKSLGLLNSVWALIIPGLLSAYNMLIMKGFFEQLPEGIEEAARIDGAGELTMIGRIVLPLSAPIIATLGLFYAVGHWNSFFDAILYINDPSKFPLQVVLRGILLGAANLSADNPESIDAVNPLSIQMAAVVVATVPILCVYPFLQKHFTKGVLLGSVKG